MKTEVISINGKEKIELGNMILDKSLSMLRDEMIREDKLEAKRQQKIKEAYKHGALLATNQPCQMLLIRRMN